MGSRFHDFQIVSISGLRTFILQAEQSICFPSSPFSFAQSVISLGPKPGPKENPFGMILSSVLPDQNCSGMASRKNPGLSGLPMQLKSLGIAITLSRDAEIGLPPSILAGRRP